MSLSVKPAVAHPTAHTLSGPSAPSAPGLYDTLRASGRNGADGLQYDAATGLAAPQPPKSTHPLEAHLANYTSHQARLRNTILRRQHGIAAPVIRSMELLDCARSKSLRPAALDSVYGTGVGRGVHEDVLSGADWGCEWEDVYHGADMYDSAEGVWGALETARGLGW